MTKQSEARSGQVTWQSLNKRQQDYLTVIFEQDQAQERAEKSRAARTWSSRPADEWRWIEYADTIYGHTPLKQAIKDAGMVDPGTGSTFKALEERGYILVNSYKLNPHHRSALVAHIRLTTKGRRLVRNALDIKARVTLPIGTLREWHWKALCRAYVRGDEGLEYDKDTGDGFGYLNWNTCLRLRDYKVGGEEKPLIGEKRFSGEGAYTVAGYTFKRGYEARLCITDFGKQYYCDNWQRYHELYPEVDAPPPDENKESE